MYGIEIIVSVIVCVSVSIGIFFVARISLTQTDMIVSNEHMKPKVKVTKKSPKIKLAKKETDNNTNVTETFDETNPQKSQKTTKKAKHGDTEVKASIASTSVDRAAVDPAADWKKVSKPTRKVSKKENKLDSVDEVVMESGEHERAAVSVTEDQEPAFVTEKAPKGKKSKKVSKQQPESTKPPKIETEKIPEPKEKIVAEDIKQQVVNEEMDLRRRIGELMSELDKQKSAKKEENKVSLQTINQLNKELDTIKQKNKVCQINEDNMVEELKKKNSSFSDLKQQFVIVQSELTKNIVQLQSLGREKEKLESRLLSVEAQNKPLAEKSEMYDRVNSERDSLVHKLSTLEDEYRTSNARFNELFKAKETESVDKINQLQSEKQRMQDQLIRVQTDLLENNSKLQNMQQDLLKTKNTYTDLLNENMRLQNSCSTLESVNVDLKQQQLVGNTGRDREMSERMTQFTVDYDKLRTANEQLVEENITLKKQCHGPVPDHTVEGTLREKLAGLTHELDRVNHLLAQASTADSEINKLKCEMTDLLSSVDHYKGELESKDSDLLKLNISFKEQEAEWRERLHQSEVEAEKIRASLNQALNNAKNLESSTKNESENDNDKYNKLMTEINELKAEKDSLVSLVEQYKTGLENTELILSRLQAAVTEEEAKWRDSLQKSESEAVKCSNELEKVYNDLMRIRNVRADKNDLTFAYHCVDKSLSSLIDDMETQMNHFETSLQCMVQERDSALAQVHAQMNGTNKDKDNIHGTNIVNGDNSNDEMIKMKEDLANEMERNKSMEMHCNKYKSLVDIGKDALVAEEVKVQALELQLQLLQSQLSPEVKEQL